MEEYIWPIEPKYKVAEHDKYGIRLNHYVLFKQRAHSGFDITADYGTEVHPITSGTVLLAEFDGTTTEGFDGRRVVYGHLSEILVKPGDKVTQESIIGKTGCSGGSRVPHLHIEIRKTNTDETGLDYTINPLELLPKRNLDELTMEYTNEPYAHLWKIMTSDSPWSFTKEDIPYSEDKNYIK